MNKRDIFSRTELLLGEEAMERLGRAKVIVFGVGGVGSWCAEGLVRSGIGHLTIVDPDCVGETNVNRQLMATTATIGQPKVEVLKARPKNNTKKTLIAFFIFNCLLLVFFCNYSTSISIYAISHSIIRAILFILLF